MSEPGTCSRSSSTDCAGDDVRELVADELVVDDTHGRESTAVSIDGKALPDAGAYHCRVALRELGRHEILQAVAEYDRLGQDRFLEKYGFGAARSYRLVVDGKAYDSKAIVGAAHGFLQGQKPLAAADFSRGAAEG